MKKNLIRLGTIGALAFISGPLALVALFASIALPALGAYSSPNVTTKSFLTGSNTGEQNVPNIEEEIWSTTWYKGSMSNVMDCPLVEMSGEKDPGKAVIQTTDTEKVAGTVVHVSTYGGFAGPGTGGATRAGLEQKFQVGSFDVQIGRWWFGYAYQVKSRDETMLGKTSGNLINSLVSEALMQQFAKKRNDDMLRLMIAHADANARNNTFTASGPSTVATIKTAHYIDTPTISRLRNNMTSNGAIPMSMGPMDSGGSRPKNYVLLSPNTSLSRLFAESDYSRAIQNAADRGKNNPWFKGNIVEIDGVNVYRWDQTDHGNWGPVGSPLSPRMYLGRATTGITFAGTATGANAITSADPGNALTDYGAQANGASACMSLIGGGSDIAARANPFPLYTQDFSNAPWTYHNQLTIAADESTARYVMVFHPTNGTWGVFKYTLNNGTALKLTHNYKFASGIDITNQTTDWVFPIGSLAVECNILGTPIGRSIGLGKEAIITGVGTINGSKASPQFARRTEVADSNHGLDVAIGGEAVWGCALIKRSDNVAPGFIVINHAVDVPGAPTVS